MISHLRWFKTPRFCDLVAVFSIFFSVFWLQSHIASNWASYGVFDQYNVIFDSDPNSWKAIFANGWSVGAFSHPLLTYYFSIPIRAFAALTSLLGLVDNEIAFREALAIYVPPLCAALKAVCLYISFRLLSLAAFQACLATGIGALSFSAILFGATPSSYAVTGLGLSLITLFALLAYRRKSVLNHIGLLLSGLFATGITVSNIIHWGWIRWALPTAKGYAPLTALGRAVIFAAIVLIATLSISFVLSEMRGVEKTPSNLSVLGDFIEVYKPDSKTQIENLVRFPERVARTFLPTVPARKDNVLAIRHDNPIRFELTYNSLEYNGFSLILGVTSFLVFAGGAIIAYGQGGAWRWIALASAASVLTFGALYSWFGNNTFLYSQHWQVPCLFLLGAWFNCSFFKSIHGYLLVMGLLILLLIGDIYVVQLINEWIVESR